MILRDYRQHLDVPYDYVYPNDSNSTTELSSVSTTDFNLPFSDN